MKFSVSRTLNYLMNSFNNFEQIFYSLKNPNWENYCRYKYQIIVINK